MNVRELIALLETFDGDLPVEMGMNQEYQSPVSAEDISVQSFDFHNNGQPYLFIGD